LLIVFPTREISPELSRCSAVQFACSIADNEKQSIAADLLHHSGSKLGAPQQGGDLSALPLLKASAICLPETARIPNQSLISVAILSAL
jgi:hypothetical protein